jgi:hypothetical protein
MKKSKQHNYKFAINFFESCDVTLGFLELKPPLHYAPSRAELECGLPTVFILPLSGILSHR